MTRILLLFAHPAFDRSRVHAGFLEALPDLPGLTFHDLYEAYPDYDVDVRREQELLTEHDLVILQHPFFWYSVPPLVKQWIDLVLEHGWAYGSTGRALEGKRMLNLVTTGGPERAYDAAQSGRFSVREYLLPIEQTARLCRMEYLPPWVVNGTHRMDPPEIGTAASEYRRLLEWLHSGNPDPLPGREVPVLNELVPAAVGGSR